MNVMNVIVIQSLNSNLLFCRACLLTDCRLFNIHEYKLADALAQISGTSACDGGLPPYLCTHCRTLLLKCASFRAMCVRTHQAVLLHEIQGKLITDSLRRNLYFFSHPLINLKLTETQLVQCIHERAPENVQNNLNDIVDPLANLDVIVQYEPSLDDIDIDPNLNESYIVDPSLDNIDIDESNLDNINVDERNIDNIDKDRIQKGQDADSVLGKECSTREFEAHENDDKTKGAVVDKVEDKVVIKDVETIKLLEKSTTTESEMNKDIQDRNKVCEVKCLNKAKVIKNKKKKKVSVDNADALHSNLAKKREKRIVEDTNDSTPANDNQSVFRFSKFERDYSVKVDILSKEEQLEEIAARRRSAQYLDAAYKCEPCGAAYSNQRALDNHRWRHLPEAGEHACAVCGLRFDRACRRNSHLTQHRLRLQCTECPYVCRDRYRARLHHETAHRGRRFKCPHCDNTYCHPTTYLSHVRLRHADVNVPCADCGETFVNQRGLAKHRKMVHESYALKCRTCRATFASEQALQAHVRETHPVEERRCEENQYLLECHRNKHLAVKPYGCAHCPRTFAAAEVLVVHLRTHTGERPYKCPKCPLTFSQLGNRNRHHNTVHLGVHARAACPQCARVFTTRSCLRLHVRRVHEGAPYPKRIRTRKPKDKAKAAANHGDTDNK